VREFARGDDVLYTKSSGELVRACVLSVHHDDFPDIYYTIWLEDGTDKQTVSEKLSSVQPQTGSVDSAGVQSELEALRLANQEQAARLREREAELETACRNEEAAEERLRARVERNNRDQCPCAERARMEGHCDIVRSVAFSPDSKSIVSGSLDCTVRVWDVASGAERARIERHRSYVESVAFSPDGKSIVSGPRDKTVRVWGVASGAERARMKGHGDTVRSVAFSPDGKSIVSGSDDETVRIWGAPKVTNSIHGMFRGIWSR
jgi:WD40 repeat protein